MNAAIVSQRALQTDKRKQTTRSAIAVAELMRNDRITARTLFKGLKI